MHVDARALTTRLGRAEKTVARIARNAINDAAFEARKSTPDYLRTAIDRPTPFTTSPGSARVERASYADLTATLYVAPRQAEYLRQIEHGLLSERLIQPVSRSAFSAYGGIAGRFKRTAANMQRLQADTRNQKSGYFVGTPKGAKRDFAGIFQRRGRARFVTVATFIKSRRSRRTISIREYWAGILPRIIDENVAKQREDPRNAL